MRRLAPAIALLLLAAAAPALADDVRPAFLSLTETAPGQYDVLFKVPRLGDRVLALRPVLPEPFRRINEPEVEVTGDAQLTRYTVQADSWELTGTEVTIDGLAATIVDTLVRVQFADGSVVTRVLRPDAPSCAMPLPRRGGGEAVSAFSPAAAARGTVLAGIRHALTGLPHLLFILSIALLGRMRSAAVATGVFLAGHVAGSVVGSAFGLAAPAPLAEALLAGAAAVIAAQRATGRGLLVAIGVAGAVHGTAVAAGKPLLAALGTTLGIDAAQLILAACAAGLAGLLLRHARTRSFARYAVGAPAVFVALVLAAEVAPRDTGPRAPLVSLAVAAPTDGPGSTALAPATDAPVRIYVQVEPFETRLEAVCRLTSLDPDLGGADVVAIADQEEILRRVEGQVAMITGVAVDGKAVSPAFRRIDFVTQSDTGVLERPEPVPERVDEAFVGIVLSYPTDGVPDEVKIHWPVFPDGGAVPAVIVDPEATRARGLAPDRPYLVWKNELRADPIPTIAAVAVRDNAVGVSVFSLLLVAATVALGVLALRRGRLADGLAIGRLLLAGACVVAPFVTVPIPMPSGAAPDDREAAAIVEALLTNVHRSFDHPEEEGVYGRLEVSVTGEQLESIYLEHRKTLELARRGGARARADSVEVQEVREVRPLDGGGFEAEADWQVSGFVVHFGHRHFRRNRYRALVTVAADGESWKIREIDVREKQRVR